MYQGQKMKKYIFITLIFLTLSSNASSINSTGYEPIEQLQAWETKIGVFFKSNQKHKCSSKELKNRFLADAKKEHHVKFLLSAFLSGKKVSVSYGCNSDNEPLINGIRVKAS